ncbi:MAG: 4-hydroxy-tetrahydrodipicolinate synthase [Deltaproteobacteria bacterium]|nr:4-hydroxy-tetrahydrodipicolinate synthase [Deltaproteobacteria bacterium]
MRPRFTGSMVALLTPFRDGAIDWQAFGTMIEAQIAGGSAALVPCGSTGEAATLSHDEHAEVIRFVVERAGGRVPVIAGAGSNSTAEAIRLTTGAKRAGAAAALLISPYYNKPTQEGLGRHYLAIADAVDLPLILYNIPGRTASRIEAATIARIAEHPNVVGLKESDALDHTLDVFHLAGDRLAIYAGDDAVTLSLMALGGAGVITTIGNIVPREMADLAAVCAAGDWTRARTLQFRLLPLIHACFTETNPIPIKHAAALLGLCRDELRLPLTPLTDAAKRAQLEAALRDLGRLR